MSAALHAARMNMIFLSSCEKLPICVLRDSPNYRTTRLLRCRETRGFLYVKKEFQLFLVACVDSGHPVNEWDFRSKPEKNLGVYDKRRIRERRGEKRGERDYLTNI